MIDHDPLIKALFAAAGIPVNIVDVTPCPIEEIPDSDLIALWNRNCQEWEETGMDHVEPSDHHYKMMEDCHRELNRRGLGVHCAC